MSARFKRPTTHRATPPTTAHQKACAGRACAYLARTGRMGTPSLPSKNHREHLQTPPRAVETPPRLRAKRVDFVGGCRATREKRLRGLGRGLRIAGSVGNRREKCDFVKNRSGPILEPPAYRKNHDGKRRLACCSNQRLEIKNEISERRNASSKGGVVAQYH